MRDIHSRGMELGRVRIEDIKSDTESRDDIPPLSAGLQHLYRDEKLRTRLFELSDKYILPCIDRKVGRPGMEMRWIPVMSAVEQGTGCDFDTIFTNW